MGLNAEKKQHLNQSGRDPNHTCWPGAQITVSTGHVAISAPSQQVWQDPGSLLSTKRGGKASHRKN